MKMSLTKLFCMTLVLLSFIITISACNDYTPKVEFIVDGEVYSTANPADGETIKAPKNPLKNGYTFLGWYNEDSLWDFDSDTVNKNITLTARWSLNTYTASFYNGDVLVETKTFTVEDGSMLTAPEVPEKLGYECKWNDLTIKPQNLIINLTYTRNLTYDMHQKMTPQQKREWYESFDTPDDYYEWRAAAKKKYDDEYRKVIGNGSTVDLNKGAESS